MDAKREIAAAIGAVRRKGMIPKVSAKDNELAEDGYGEKTRQVDDRCYSREEKSEIRKLTDRLEEVRLRLVKLESKLDTHIGTPVKLAHRG